MLRQVEPAGTSRNGFCSVIAEILAAVGKTPRGRRANRAERQAECKGVERRQLLWSSLIWLGRTALCERVSPEDMDGMGESTVRLAPQSLGRYDGHVRAGNWLNGIVAFFGFSGGTERCRRNVRSGGLKLSAAVGRLNSSHGEALQLRIGDRARPGGCCNGGVVVTVVGDVLEPARFESFAEPGRVLVGGDASVDAGFLEHLFARRA